MESTNNARIISETQKHRILLVFGPSQFGKSTFINNLLEFSNSNSVRAEVGIGSGESVTISVNTYNVGNIPAMFPNDRLNYDTLHIIDVPGIFDSGLRISQEEIFSCIRQVLLQHNITTLDSILVFESMKDDARKILITLKAATDLFGPSALKSILVLSTKWDRVYDDELQNIEAYFISIIKRMNVDTMKWQNNFGTTELLSHEQMESQISELGTRIRNLKQYYVQGMDELLRERDNLAENIRSADKNRYATYEEEIEIAIPEEYIEEHEIETVDMVLLTQEEIETRAHELWNAQPSVPGGLVPHPTLRETSIVKRLIPSSEEKTHNFTIGWIFKDTIEIPYQVMKFVEQEEIIDLGPKMIPGESPKLPLEFFITQLRHEFKPVKVKKKLPIKLIRMRPGTKIIKSRHERHDFDHYRNLAVKQLQAKFIESYRDYKRG